MAFGRMGAGFSRLGTRGGGAVAGVFYEPNPNLMVNPEALNLWPTLT